MHKPSGDNEESFLNQSESYISSGESKNHDEKEEEEEQEISRNSSKYKLLSSLD
jgi:hypothetical protein